MSTAQTIGIVASETDKLLVQRQGEQLTLRQGDAILAGDVLQNKDGTAVHIELPGQAAGQANSLVTLAPESAAQIAVKSAAEGGMIEITSLTEGVELFAVSEGSNGAILVADAGSGFSGLVGAGLLSAGTAGGVSGIATAIGGGVGIAALAASSDDSNIEGSAFTDVRVDNGDETTDPVTNPENPGENENPDEPTENPEEPIDNPEEPEEPTTPVDEGTTGTPLDAVLDPLADALGGTPLAVVSDPLFDALGSLPIGSAPNPANSLPLDAITGNLPV
ncbi:MAG: hypothetical protein LW710_05140 [Burkholderiales bacterium]|jgi:hypothetical protein|uniref:hypothetical protein n=1 Tax=Limnobacter sp. TaxID=2003368 RepID=UPI00393BFD66|nr:hypothetical protein [Burkholderiales bacterium]